MTGTSLRANSLVRMVLHLREPALAFQHSGHSFPGQFLRLRVHLTVSLRMIACHNERDVPFRNTVGFHIPRCFLRWVDIPRNAPGRHECDGERDRQSSVSPQHLWMVRISATGAQPRRILLPASCVDGPFIAAFLGSGWEWERGVRGWGSASSRADSVWRGQSTDAACGRSDGVLSDELRECELGRAK